MTEDQRRLETLRITLFLCLTAHSVSIPRLRTRSSGYGLRTEWASYGLLCYPGVTKPWKLRHRGLSYEISVNNHHSYLTCWVFSLHSAGSSSYLSRIFTYIINYHKFLKYFLFIFCILGSFTSYVPFIVTAYYISALWI